MLITCIVVTIIIIVLLILAAIWFARRDRPKNIKGGMRMNGGNDPPPPIPFNIPPDNPNIAIYTINAAALWPSNMAEAAIKLNEFTNAIRAQPVDGKIEFLLYIIGSAINIDENINAILTHIIGQIPGEYFQWLTAKAKGSVEISEPDVTLTINNFAEQVRGSVCLWACRTLLNDNEAVARLITVEAVIPNEVTFLNTIDTCPPIITPFVIKYNVYRHILRNASLCTEQYVSIHSTGVMDRVSIYWGAFNNALQIASAFGIPLEVEGYLSMLILPNFCDANTSLIEKACICNDALCQIVSIFPNSIVAISDVILARIGMELEARLIPGADSPYDVHMFMQSVMNCLKSCMDAADDAYTAQKQQQLIEIFVAYAQRVPPSSLYFAGIEPIINAINHTFGDIDDE